MRKIIDKKYNKKLVIKPWGQEHVIYRDKNILSVTLLKINYKHQTSLHCHPKKKTGFILINGTAKIQLGLWKSNIKTYKSPSKLMIRQGLFHSIKSVSKKGLIALEFETPVMKNDLVRYEDIYGRSLKSYEGKKHLKDISKNNIFFRNIKKFPIQRFIFGKTLLVLKIYKDFKSIIKKSDKTIFAVLKGKIVDKKNRSILSKGDIIKTGTFKKLAKKFFIKNNLLLISVERFAKKSF